MKSLMIVLNKDKNLDLINKEMIVNLLLITNKLIIKVHLGQPQTLIHLSLPILYNSRIINNQMITNNIMIQV